MQLPRPALIAILACLGVLAGCGGSSVPAAGAGPTRLVRVAFCDLVPAAAVRQPLTGPPARTATWSPGEPVPADAAGGGIPDVSDEFGCSWSGPAKTAARAWVFAHPVSPAYARAVLPASKQTGCRLRSGTAPVPSLVEVCAAAPVSAGSPTVRLRSGGLYGDTWLTCELSGPAATTTPTRLDDWCAAVRKALTTGS